MDSNEIKALSNYRLAQAKENLEEATVLADINKYKGASNRAYYAIFHAIKAILALEEVDFKRKRYLFKQNEKIGVKSIDGNIIIPAIYDKIFLKNDNLYTVCIDKNIENSCGSCKKDGTIILEPKYYNIQVCNNRTIISNKKPGVEVFEYEIVR